MKIKPDKDFILYASRYQNDFILKNKDIMFENICLQIEVGENLFTSLFHTVTDPVRDFIANENSRSNNKF